jgi:hypothetical protein
MLGHGHIGIDDAANEIGNGSVEVIFGHGGSMIGAMRQVFILAAKAAAWPAASV